MARIATRRRTSGHSGFTLIEVMVVITLLGLIAAAVAMNLVGVTKEAHQKLARMDMKSIGDALEVYRLKHAKLPESLDALVSDHELKVLPRDPWRGPYLYERADNADGYRISTLGADGASGGDGENADLHSDDADATQ